MLIQVKVAGVDIDDGNSKKITKHGLTVDQVCAFFDSEFFILSDPRHSLRETRFLAFGVVEGVKILVVFTLRAKRGQLLFRPVSARMMHQKEWEVLNEKLKKS